MGFFWIMSGYFSHASMSYSKQLIEVVFGAAIFMQSTSLKYKLTVKVSANFIKQINHETYIKQPLLELKSIYSEQSMQVLDLNSLLTISNLMVSIL